jgi:hypothetical protein
VDTLTFRDDPSICIGREAAVSDREGVRRGAGAACSFPESRRRKTRVRIFRQDLPAKRIPAQIRSLCRAYTGEAVRSLATIVRQADAPPRARIQAIAVLLYRGWGRAPQPQAGEDDGDLRVVIRQIGESRD